MDLLQTLVEGGPLMVPLMVCSILTLAVMIDRTLAFHYHRNIDARSLRAKILEFLGRGRLEDAAMLCANTPGPVSAVLLAGLQSYAKHRGIAARPELLTATMEKAMDDYSVHAISAVEQRLEILRTVGNAAPLLGMAGTVTGMIRSFSALQEVAGMDPGAVAAGISEALITTAAGLLIAIAAVIPWNIFISLSDRIDREIGEASSELLDFVATRLATASA